MNLEQLLDALRADGTFMSCVSRWHTEAPRPARYAPWPDCVEDRLREALLKKGIQALYSHQAAAVAAAARGQDTVVVTPTASGKTLCYNLPVLSAILKEPDSRALYLFPTKALSADQTAELYEMVTLLEADIKAYTYDGDTPASARRAIRQAGHIVVTNPDMLHSNILPHHTKWVRLFENLKYIVIDEVHAYRGVFGSNLANVIRRLLRLCAFYGSSPAFILLSATIANPRELVRLLTGRETLLIDDSGAPLGERHFIFYNPPVVNRQLGIRKSALHEARSIASLLLKNGIRSILFARSRVQVEVLTKSLKELAADRLGRADSVRGYRGGYLPSERREIERSLRAGQVDMVISTNVLELGIDIGALEACVLCGYPGTIASTWQQAGRAGRRLAPSLTVLVASSAPMDQYLITHPDYFLSRSPEHALLNPDNLYILLSHFKCAAYELPFRDGEGFGSTPEEAQGMLSYLEENGILRHAGDTWHWSAEDFPASEISLRTAMTENFLILDITVPARVRVVGEMDRFTVPMLLHENAIYLHEGAQYQVEKLDFDACKAFVRQVQVDYYTDADLNVSLSLLDIHRREGPAAHGDVRVSALVKIFKKMKFDTGESLGYGPVRLPETDMHTTAFWLTLPSDIGSRYSRDSLQSGMLGLSNLLSIAAPLHLMCSPRDIAVLYQVKCPFTDLPTLILYDNCPGGVGLSEKAFVLRDTLLARSLEIVQGCGCESGCPSCVGPAAGGEGKRIAGELAGTFLKML